MTTERQVIDPEAEEARETQQTDEAAGPSTADLARAGADTHNQDDDTSRDGDDERPTPLFAEADATGYRDRWLEVQTQFVDDPRQAVEGADTLVAELMQKLAETFASERSDLEQQWDRGGKVSTEDLRISLQRYRSFFDRLLSL
jgi:hypothetical protein